MNTDDEMADAMSEALAALHLRESAANTPEALVKIELDRLRAREAAKKAYRRELEGDYAPLDVSTGTQLAARALEAPRWRVEGLMPAEGSTLITAQRKTGKTTLALNLARCLMTGEPFLGHFPVNPIAGRVGLLNYEVSGPQLGRWAAESGVPLDRLVVANLRARRNPLGHDRDRSELAETFAAQSVEVVICDPFANAFDGDNQNDAGQVARFLHSLGEFARREVGATDLVLTNHAGWDASRTRGSSALEDWPDSLVKLTMDNYGARYLSALGRDVDVPEGRLHFDPETRTLRLDRTANRVMEEQSKRHDELIGYVVEVVSEHPGAGTREVQSALSARGVLGRKELLRPAIDAAVARGLLEVRQEANRKRAHYPASPAETASDMAGVPVSPSVPACPQRTPAQVSPVPIGGHHTGTPTKRDAGGGRQLGGTPAEAASATFSGGAS